VVAFELFGIFSVALAAHQTRIGIPECRFVDIRDANITTRMPFFINDGFQPAGRSLKVGDFLRRAETLHVASGRLDAGESLPDQHFSDAVITLPAKLRFPFVDLHVTYRVS